MKVYVTSPIGCRVAGLGSRERGEFFEVSEEVARQLLLMPGFETREELPTPKKRAMRIESIETVPVEDVSQER